MTLNFCTLFDSNYLSRGLALLQSLKTVSDNFHLYVGAFDDDCLAYLKSLNDKDLTVISLAEFENQPLLEVKKGRTPAEYCWTCTPFLIAYCIENYHLPSCIYLDADMIFYENPQILLSELNDASVLITEHRFTREYDVSETHGIYCVQFMYFKNDDKGLKALYWWRDRCLEWCFAYLEDGKFGDQKYLDDWTTRFEGVHVLKNPGGGLAPWNVQQYDVAEKEQEITITDKNGNHSRLVFFHFHGVKFYSDETVECCGALYGIDESAKKILYFPYFRDLLQIGDKVSMSGFPRNPHGAQNPSPAPEKILINYIRDVIFLIGKGKTSLFNGRIYNFSLHRHLYKLRQFK